MPIRIPMHSIAVVREGQTIIPEIGRPFEFTDAEIQDVFAAEPAIPAFDEEAEKTAKMLSDSAPKVGSGKKGRAADTDADDL